MNIISQDINPPSHYFNLQPSPIPTWR